MEKKMSFQSRRCSFCLHFGIFEIFVLRVFQLFLAHLDCLRLELFWFSRLWPIKNTRQEANRRKLRRDLWDKDSLLPQSFLSRLVRWACSLWFDSSLLRSVSKVYLGNYLRCLLPMTINTYHCGQIRHLSTIFSWCFYPPYNNLLLITRWFLIL